MKINRNNRDFKIINSNRGYSCCSCVFDSVYTYPCVLFCCSGKIWIKDIVNSDIFRL